MRSAVIRRFRDQPRAARYFVTYFDNSYFEHVHCQGQTAFLRGDTPLHRGRYRLRRAATVTKTTHPTPVSIADAYRSQSAANKKMEKVMSVTLFPNVLEPATALKTYAPISVKFWENQAATLEGLKEFSDGWFVRRYKSTQAALEAAKHIGDAATPSDVFREYQNWLARAMELLAEDGKAYQQQMLRAAVHVSAPVEARRADEQSTG
jgi:hypothetical protein